MIYRAIQLIQIFCAHKRTNERTNERTKVIQEVLADLKTYYITYRFALIDIIKQISRSFCVRMWNGSAFVEIDFDQESKLRNVHF